MSRHNEEQQSNVGSRPKRIESNTNRNMACLYMHRKE